MFLHAHHELHIVHTNILVLEPTVAKMASTLNCRCLDTIRTLYRLQIFVNNVQVHDRNITVQPRLSTCLRPAKYINAHVQRVWPMIFRGVVTVEL